MEINYVACLEPTGDILNGKIKKVRDIDKFFSKMEVRWLTVYASDYTEIIEWTSEEGWVPIVVDDCCWLV